MLNEEEYEELHKCVERYGELVKEFHESEKFSREAFEERSMYRKRAIELLKKSSQT